MQDIKTILLVEPDLSLREFFTQIFINAGHNPLCMKDESEIETLTEEEAKELDLIVVDDADQPKIFTRKVREIYEAIKLKPVPIIGLLKKGALLSETTESHFDEVLVKDNFNLQIFTDCVQDLLSVRRR